MLRGFTFGCGQGATKAMITCIENGVLNRKDCCVINSTTKDIPEGYVEDAIVISDNPDAGCGKERETARGLMANYLRTKPIDIIEKILDYDYVNIIAAAEGASGSGASVVLARYIACTDFSKFTDDTEPIHIPVIITLITGFETDVRGMSNTINYFKDLNGVDITIRTVSNKTFLEDTPNIFQAEKMANEEISTAFKVITASDLDNSEQNIDDTDHFKIITNPGMMFVTEIKVDKKIKNANQLERMISDAIDYSHSLEFVPSATKIGLYMNLSEDTLSHIDTSFPSIKNKLCGGDIIPEFFVHKQYNGKDEYVRIIATGIKLPEEEIVSLYNKFQTNKSNAESEDSFFSTISGLNTSFSTTEERSNTDAVDDMLNSFSDNVGSLARRNKRRLSIPRGNINANTAVEETIQSTPNESAKVQSNNNSTRTAMFGTKNHVKKFDETAESRGGKLIQDNPFVEKN